MKRSVPLSPDVVHKIWSLWQDGDLDEDAILRRVLTELQEKAAMKSTERKLGETNKKNEEKEENKYNSPAERQSAGESNMIGMLDTPALGKVRWVDDIRAALMELGGEAELATIYSAVERIRKDGGRTIPKSLTATVRQSIEAHCPTSENYREGNGNYFKHIARGRYQLIR